MERAPSSTVSDLPIIAFVSVSFFFVTDGVPIFWARLINFLEFRGWINLMWPQCGSIVSNPQPLEAIRSLMSADLI